jgi:hypothetical protein
MEGSNACISLKMSMKKEDVDFEVQDCCSPGK